MSTADTDAIGPIDYVLIEIDPDKATGEVAASLIELVDGGTVRLLDVALVAKEADGTVLRVDLNAVADDVAPGFASVAGAQSGLLSDDDIADAGAAIEAGKLGAIIVYENAWAAPFVAAARRAGGEMIASARIPAQDLLDALDAADAAN